MNNPFEQHGIQHLSPSQINLFCTAPALWVMEKLLKIRSPVGAAAHRGTAAEDGIVAGLMEPSKPVEECVEIANRRFRELTALSRDPNRAKESEAIAGIVKQGLAELRPYGVPTSTQGKIEYHAEGLTVPIIGFYDAAWDQHGIMTDIKTQLRLNSQIKTPHARQVSLYKAAISDNIDARVSYITDKKAATYHLENHRDHVNALVKIALTIQRFLSLSKDARELAALVVPDTDSFFYNDPVARQNAFEVYGF